jgi:hypothetical protein
MSNIILNYKVYKVFVNKKKFKTNKRLENNIIMRYIIYNT